MARGLCFRKHSKGDPRPPAGVIAKFGVGIAPGICSPDESRMASEWPQKINTRNQVNGNCLLEKRKERGVGRVEHLGLEFMRGGIAKLEARHASSQL